MGTAVVVHGEEWARLSARLDRAEALNRELVEALDVALGYWRMVCTCNAGIDKCDSCYHKRRVNDLLARAEEEVE